MSLRHSWKLFSGLIGQNIYINRSLYNYISKAKLTQNKSIFRLGQYHVKTIHPYLEMEMEMKKKQKIEMELEVSTHNVNVIYYYYS